MKHFDGKAVTYRNKASLGRLHAEGVVTAVVVDETDPGLLLPGVTLDLNGDPGRTRVVLEDDHLSQGVVGGQFDRVFLYDILLGSFPVIVHLTH